jgi:hypothetical protein
MLKGTPQLRKHPVYLFCSNDIFFPLVAKDNVRNIAGRLKQIVERKSNGLISK